MKRIYCYFERIGGVVFGAIALVAALALLLLGFAALAPAVGILFAIPISLLCIRLVAAPLSRTCSL